MAKDIDDDTEVKALPGSEVLAKLLKVLSEHGSTLAEVRGHIGAAIKDAEETNNVHRGVIKLIAKLEKMDDTKRAEWFRHFDHYADERGLRDQSQPDLFDDGIDGDEA